MWHKVNVGLLPLPDYQVTLSIPTARGEFTSRYFILISQLGG